VGLGQKPFRTYNWRCLFRATRFFSRSYGVGGQGETTIGGKGRPGRGGDLGGGGTSPAEGVGAEVAHRRGTADLFKL